MDEIKTKEETLRLKKPIEISATYQDKLYSCNNANLGVITISTKLQDCIKEFEEEIVFLWNEYGKENDERLTKDAIELKRKILDFVAT